MSQAQDRALLDATLRQTAKVESDGTTLVNTYQDVEPCMDYAAALRRADGEERGTFGRRKDLHHTMSVPFNIMLATAERLGIPAGEIFATEHAKRIMQELKRPEFAVFRTTIDKAI